MATRGRPRKSDAEKAAAGTLRKDRMQPEPLDVKLDNIPDPPVEFSAHELQFYQDECSFLLDVGALSYNRVKRVQVAAMWWHLYKKSSIALRNTYLVSAKSGWEQISPEVTLLEKSTRWLNAYYSDRDKIKAAPKKKKNELDELL